MSTLSPVRRAASPNASAAESSPARLLTSEPRSTTPRVARLIARGYTRFIRRTIAIVSPLRRATDAWNAISSSAGMPASTTRPPGRADSTASRTPSSVPAASNATSTPAPTSSRTVAEAKPGSAATSAPNRAAASRRCASGSTASTELAPAAFSTPISSSPIGPQPTTDAVPPNGRWPRSTLCSATPSGSSKAPSASETPSGSEYSNSVGQVMNSRIMPSVSPCPANRIR
jgi:hypothetical protein